MARTRRSRPHTGRAGTGRGAGKPRRRLRGRRGAARRGSPRRRCRRTAPNGKRLRGDGEGAGRASSRSTNARPARTAPPRMHSGAWRCPWSDARRSARRTRLPAPSTCSAGTKPVVVRQRVREPEASACDALAASPRPSRSPSFYVEDPGGVERGGVHASPPGREVPAAASWRSRPSSKWRGSRIPSRAGLFALGPGRSARQSQPTGALQPTFRRPHRPGPRTRSRTRCSGRRRRRRRAPA